MAGEIQLPEDAVYARFVFIQNSLGPPSIPDLIISPSHSFSYGTPELEIPRGDILG